MAQSGPGIDCPGEWFIGSVNTTSLVLGQERAIVIDNTTSPPTVTINGTPINPGGEVWQYASAPATTIRPNPTRTGVPASANFLVSNPIAGASTEGASIRQMFIANTGADEGAFRAGRVTGTQWDAVNRGSYSVAFGSDNIASGSDSVVAGGSSNTASGLASVVCGGQTNTASNARSTVCGGASNTASGSDSIVLGGLNNTSSAGEAISGGVGCVASGTAAVAFGSACLASGNQSICLGSGANSSSKNNAFVWSDANGLVIGGGAVANSVWWAAGSGATGADPVYTIYTNTARSTGMQLFGGGAAWVAISDVNRKEHLEELKYADVLAKVESLPIWQFNYKGTPEDQLYRGPTAQDWHERFPSGKYKLGIDTLDLDGITLAALKGLAGQVRAQVRAQNERIAALEAMRP